jgi:hypothetical protein
MSAVNKTRIAAVVCALSLAVCFLQGWSKSSGGMDLPWYVYPAKFWMAGGNPYGTSADAGLPAAWRAPGMVYNCALAPQSFWQMAPLAALPWQTAVKAWWLVSFGSLLASFWLLMRLFGRRWTAAEQMWFVAIVAQSKIIQSVAYRGQISLFCLAMALLAVWLAAKSRSDRLSVFSDQSTLDHRSAFRTSQSAVRNCAAGFALALACVKFILVPPVILYWFWKRQWKALGWFAAFAAVFNVVPLLLMGPGAVARSILPSFQRYAAWERGLHGGSSHIMNWGEIYEWAFGAGAPLASVLGAVTLLAAGAALWTVCRRRRDDADGWGFAAIVLFTMVAAYHRVYDGVFVFIAAAWWWSAFRSREARTARLWAAGAAMGAFLFVTSIQGVATALEGFCKSHGALTILAPVNAWACLTAFWLMIWAGAAVPQRAEHAITEEDRRQTARVA